MTASMSNQARKILDLAPSRSRFNECRRKRLRSRKPYHIEILDEDSQGKLTPAMRAYLKTFDEYLARSSTMDDDESQRLLLKKDTALEKIAGHVYKNWRGKPNIDYQDR